MFYLIIGGFYLIVFVVIFGKASLLDDDYARTRFFKKHFLFPPRICMGAGGAL